MAKTANVSSDRSEPSTVYQLKVTLAGIRPPIRRRIHVSEDISLFKLHKILVEKIFKPDEERKHPVCLKGKRSPPSEDCGGEGGYYHLLEALRDKGPPNHKYLLEWAGDEYDPEYFDVDEVNERLKKIR